MGGHPCGWTSSNPRKVLTDQKGGRKANSFSLLELGHPCSPALEHIRASGSRAVSLQDLTPVAPSVSDLWTELHHQLLWLSSLQSFPASIIT